MKCRSCSAEINTKNSDLKSLLDQDDFKISQSSKKNIDLAECTHCGLVQLSSLAEFGVVTDLYRNLQDVAYDSQHFWRKKSFDYDLARVIKVINRVPQKILEVGAFSGIGAEAITKNFPQSLYFGIEPSHWAAKQAQEKGFDVVPRAIEDPITENGFELAISWAVIEHLEDPNLFFKQLNTAVTNDAYLFMNFPDWDSLWRKLLGRFWWFVEIKHRTYFNEATISKLAMKHGWIYVDSWSQKKCRSLNYLVERILDRLNLKTSFRRFPQIEVNYYPGQLGIIFKRAPQIEKDKRPSQTSKSLIFRASN